MTSLVLILVGIERLMMNPQPNDQPKKSFDERFTDVADVVSEGMGRWWVSIVSAILIIGWTVYCMVTQGPGWWYGTFYNLPLNLVTTVAELFIGFLIAAAANRVEKRNGDLQGVQVAILKHVERLVADGDVELRELEEEVKQEKKTKMLIDHLNDQDEELLKQTNMLIDLLQKVTQRREDASGKSKTDSR
jgi:hypothetical protein